MDYSISIWWLFAGFVALRIFKRYVCIKENERLMLEKSQFLETRRKSFYNRSLNTVMRYERIKNHKLLTLLPDYYDSHVDGRQWSESVATKYYVAYFSGVKKAYCVLVLDQFNVFSDSCFVSEEELNDLYAQSTKEVHFVSKLVASEPQNMSSLLTSRVAS
ncbi:hypothetical protein R7P34_24835 [Vibrio sp. 780]|uniref:hypothetical protein n=1 Tax=unclassified Vibrio TaxID=2614977 RepID=UPI002964F0BA|nr:MULTISPECIES: hypothetical protein [unclassified Vibrio]MDW1950572.1 hypothetical protein [Vibrio sp. 812(2023)]MDW1993633.1 hypothetical protein [Vibrio sp. 780]